MIVIEITLEDDSVHDVVCMDLKEALDAIEDKYGGFMWRERKPQDFASTLFVSPCLH